MSEAPFATRQMSVGMFERASGFLAKVALVAMMTVMGAELVMRNIFRYSWEGTDEVSSFLVVAVTFFSLATCQASRGYHELEMVKGRLAPRGRAILNTVLQVVGLLCALVLLWQFSRLAFTSWKSGDTSMTALRIPFWIPQVAMPLGVAAFCVSLVKAIRRELAAALRGR